MVIWSTRLPGCKMEADPVSVSIDDTVKIWHMTTGQCEIHLSHLHTTIVTINIGSTDPVMPCSLFSACPPKQSGYALRNNHSWITYKGANLLWLPVY